ncbi:MAG: DUF6526 family protein [Acidobacteriota bacterium]|nr:DUF6526 family protein [Acidobacteriota bacterium]
MRQEIRTRSNHTRLDPTFHFFLIPVAFLLFIWTIVHVIRHPGTDSAVLAIAVFLILFTALKARIYSAKVQDRVIRLEERLRLATYLPDSIRPRIPELSESQLVALRFAPDAELPALAERTLNEKLTKKQIKDAIKNWRGDYWRV